MQSSCPLCELDDSQVATKDGQEQLYVRCRRCGEFKITRTAARFARAEGLSSKLSAWIRSRREERVAAPEITRDALKEIAKSFPEFGISEKLLLLTRALERRTRYPGQEVEVIPAIDYPVAWADGEEEFRYLLGALIERSILRLGANSPPLDFGEETHRVVITVPGWVYLEERNRSSAASNQAFVAMSFAKGLIPAWENGIRKGLKRAQWTPYRTDTQPHIDRIDAKIMTEIKNSRFLVADVTEQKQGVYFEAGYAAGLGLPVYWCVRKDDIDNVHFDTRQYNHIVWENEEDLAEQIYNFVVAIVGKGSAR